MIYRIVCTVKFYYFLSPTREKIFFLKIKRLPNDIVVCHDLYSFICPTIFKRASLQENINRTTANNPTVTKHRELTSVR